MPVFEYTALNSAGKTISGILDADSLVAARQKLRREGIYPVGIKESTKKVKKDLLSQLTFGNRVKQEEIFVFTRQLATLLGAGIPLVASMDALVQQAVSPALKRLVAQVKESVNEGSSLTVAMSEHPKIFPAVYVNMVRAGEESGSLDIVLERLADFEEHQRALAGRFKSALIYPLFMSLVGALVLFGLFTFVIPSITQIFVEMGQVLPLPTLILIQFSGFLKSWWWGLLLAFIGAAFIVAKLFQTEDGKYFLARLKLNTPVIGQLNRKLFLARFSRTLASLIQSGVSLIVSLQIVRNIVDNVLVADVVDRAIVDINAGRSMHESLSGNKYFPLMVLQMISVGEKSGELEKMLNKIADAYETEVESQIMAITSLIEPAMIIAMGLIVGFIVVSVLLPIFEMNQMIS